MRLLGFKKKENGWTSYQYSTTYPFDWKKCLSLIYTAFEYFDNATVRVTMKVGEEPQIVALNNKNDIWKIPEGSSIQINGKNRVYDNVQTVFLAVNQSDVAIMEVPTAYVEQLKKSATEYLDEEGQKHTFDRFIDSMEIAYISYISCENATTDIADQICNALCQYALLEDKGDEESAFVYKNDKYRICVDIKKCADFIKNNYK